MYDMIIIGAGTAGIAAYKQAIKKTQKVLIINQGPWDTTCARVGCMPSKVLISSANRLHDLYHAQEVALKVKAQTDTTQVMNHVRELRDRFSQSMLKEVEAWESSHKISGQAVFINANTIEVNQKQYQAKSFIVAVGSTPAIDPEWKKELGNLLITSDQIFELDQLPKRLAVIGSGVIAIELAQAMHRLGVETTIFARSQRIGSLSSPVLQKMAQKVLSEELNIKFKVLPDKVKKYRNLVKIEFTEHGKTDHIIADYLLVATGRNSYLNSLKLEQVDSKFKDIKKLPIDPKTKQLGQYPIFVVGDAFTSTPIQHEAAHEGRGAVHNALNPLKMNNLKTLTPLGIVFSAPEMALIGQNYKQLKEKNIDFVIGMVDYSHQGRAMVLGQNQGAAEIYVDVKTRKILGAEIFTYAAEHLSHLLAWIIDENISIDDALNKPFYHPTLEEGLRTALKHAHRQLN